MTMIELVELERKILQAASDAKELNRIQDERIEALVKALGEHTTKMNEVLGIYESLKGTLRVLGWLQKAATWAAAIAAAYFTFAPSKK